MSAEEERIPINRNTDNDVRDEEATQTGDAETLVDRPSRRGRRRRTSNQGLERAQKIGICLLIALTLVVGVAIAVVLLLPARESTSKNIANDVLPEPPSSGSDNNNDNKENGNIFLAQHSTIAPSRVLKGTSEPTEEPTYSPTTHPTFYPTTLPPTSAPTVPQMGCRRDRFDNEGNFEENNLLFAGSFVCSDDVDQRYMFGIDPDTANLIWRDTLTGQVKTYYWNEWHRQYLEDQKKRQRQLKDEPEKQRELESSTDNTDREFYEFRFQKNATDPSESAEIHEYQLSKNYTATHRGECVQWIRHDDDHDKFVSLTMIHFNCTMEDLHVQIADRNFTGIVEAETGLVEFAAGAIVERPAPSASPSATPTSTTTPSATPTASPTQRPTPLPTLPPTNPPTSSPSMSPTPEPLILDYYFTLSTKADFRIWRIQRTEDYQIREKVLHWELKSTYDINTVYVDCLFTHDCPYMHLHQDGVMVLAWLDFENSQWSDGWMEKNIKRCYEFDTPDTL